MHTQENSWQEQDEQMGRHGGSVQSTIRVDQASSDCSGVCIEGYNADVVAEADAVRTDPKSCMPFTGAVTLLAQWAITRTPATAQRVHPARAGVAYTVHPTWQVACCKNQPHRLCMDYVAIYVSA